MTPLSTEQVDDFLKWARQLLDLSDSQRVNTRFAIIAIGFHDKVKWDGVGKEGCNTVYMALGQNGPDHPANLWLAMGKKMGFVGYKEEE